MTYYNTINNYCMKHLFIRTRVLARLLFVICLAGFSANLFAQKTITGVVSEKGGPILGATVLVKGSKTGKVTDMDGKYSIAVPGPEAILVFSSVGFVTKEVTVGDQTEINVVLTEEVTSLEEFVAVGYGTTKKSDLTGAVSTINNEDIKEMHVLGADQALQGKAPGVDIMSNSGSPGGNITIRIRGTGTINNADPIFVVDGLVMDPGAINFLNPADIENISVLKDASAAAIYGSRGANGVIMITTKRGKKGDPKVQFSSYIGWQKPSHFVHLTDGKQYAQLKNLRSIASGLGPEYNPDTVANVNWLQEISRTAPMYCTNASISGGNDFATYLFSASYNDQQGIIKTTDYKRITVRMNSEYQLKKWLKFGEQMQVASSNRNAITENAAYNTPIVEAMLYSPISEPFNHDGSWNYNPSQGGNPLAHLEKGISSWTTKDTRIVGSAYGEITFSKSLSFKTTLGTELDNNEYRKLTPPYSFGSDRKTASALENLWNKSYNWQWENFFTYKKTFKEKHEINFMAGTSASSWLYYTIYGINSSGPLINDPNLQYFDTYDPSGAILKGTADQASLFSLLGRLNYTYNDKYLATFSLRRDGSSKFGPSNRYGNFPSMALAWKISNEKFIKSIKFLSSLKLRFGWGKIGNEKIGTGKYLGSIALNLPYSMNGVVYQGATPLQPPNKGIKWETTIQSNYGFDAGFFKNKFLLSAEYFTRRTTDMLSKIDLPDISGIPDFQNPIGNIGEVLNKGIELTLNYRKQSGKFQYSMAGNFSKIVNKVISLGETEFITAGTYGQGYTNFSYTAPGLPIGVFYGYVTEGIFKNFQEINAHAFQSAGTMPGDLKFKDLNGDGVINDQDRTVIGNPTPKFTYGFNVSVSYGSFDLTMAFQGVYGNDILAMWKTWTNTIWNESRNYQVDMLNAWTPENSNSNVPYIDGNGDFNVNSRLSDYYIEKGSYMRLKTMQLGYTLPPTVLAKLKISSCRLYVGAQNLFTITKYSGNDPEVGLPMGNSQDNNQQLIINVDYGNVPQARIITTGIDVSF